MSTSGTQSQPGQPSTLPRSWCAQNSSMFLHIQLTAACSSTYAVAAAAAPWGSAPYPAAPAPASACLGTAATAAPAARQSRTRRPQNAHSRAPAAQVALRLPVLRRSLLHEIKRTFSLVAESVTRSGTSSLQQGLCAAHEPAGSFINQVAQGKRLHSGRARAHTGGTTSQCRRIRRGARTRRLRWLLCRRWVGCSAAVRVPASVSNGARRRRRGLT